MKIIFPENISKHRIYKPACFPRVYKGLFKREKRGPTMYCSSTNVYRLTALAVLNVFAGKSNAESRTFMKRNRACVLCNTCTGAYVSSACQLRNISGPNNAMRPWYSLSCSAGPCTSWDVYVLSYPAAVAGCRLPCSVSTAGVSNGNMRSELQMEFNGSALTLSLAPGKIRMVAQCVNQPSGSYREGLMLRLG